MLYLDTTFRPFLHATHLGKVGGSVMLAVPLAVLDILQLGPGAAVNISVDGNRLVVEAQPQPRYTLAELFAASDYSDNRTYGEQEWIDAPAILAEVMARLVTIFE